VTAAVRRELRRLEQLEPGASKQPEAALALGLAERLDDRETKATAAAMAAGRLLETLAALRALAPSGKASPLDEIRARRDARVAGAAEAADRAGT
jgi:hypothetical protein